MVITVRLGGRIQSLWVTVILSAIVNKTVNNAYSGPLVFSGSGYGHLEVIWGPVWAWSGG